MNEEKIDAFALINKFSQGCVQKNVEQIKKLNLPKTFRNIDLAWLNQLTPTDSFSDFRRRTIDFMLVDLCNTCKDDDDALLFFAAASFNLVMLAGTVARLKKKSNYCTIINRKRRTDSVIIFVLKYGDVTHDRLYECMKILVDAGVDVKKSDIEDKFAIDHIASLHNEHTSKPELSDRFQKIAKLFVDEGICEPHREETKRFVREVSGGDLPDFENPDHLDQLFSWILQPNKEKFINFEGIQKYVSKNDGQNTLLQFASMYRADRFPFVAHLLKNFADPNGTTAYNSRTPLELAGYHNNKKIFCELLKHNKTKIEEKHFNSFIKAHQQRKNPMKQELFEAVLESDKLNPHFRDKQTQDTPLHYAVYFCNQNAMRSLVKRGASLVAENKRKKSVLDVIRSSDLQDCFDSCVTEHRRCSRTDPKYNITFNFSCLVDNRAIDEMTVISRIGKRNTSEKLLTHPLIQMFLELKWFRVRKIFRIILVLQIVLLLTLAVLFYSIPSSSDEQNIPKLSHGLRAFCIVVAIVNGVIKIPWLCLNCMLTFRSSGFAGFLQVSPHAVFEISLMITSFISFFVDELRALLFVEISICILLTAGYHPKLSHWSHMLQTVFKTFILLFLFFSVIIFSFAVGFHIVVKNSKIFDNVWKASVRTFIMATGEFEIQDASFKSTEFLGYSLYVIFALCVTLVIMNFWTGVAVSDIERIRKHSELSACRNVISFITFIEHLYKNKLFKKLLECLIPLLFPNERESSCCKIKFFRSNDDQISGQCLLPDNKPSRYKIKFFMNNDDQFEERQNLPKRIRSKRTDAIRQYFSDRQTLQEQTEMRDQVKNTWKHLTSKETLLLNEQVKALLERSKTKPKDDRKIEP